MNQILLEHSPHLFLITETQLQSNSGIRFHGYTYYGRVREGKNGGGVAILARNDIRPNISIHQTERNIEIIWVSVRRKNMPPIMIGTYYGKQEAVSKDEIDREMTFLNEEILEKKKEGEILLTMDANAKIGLLGEETSRNGGELLKVFNETGLTILNGTDKCEGIVTRQNTKNPDEKSAIDFVTATLEAHSWIKNVFIDETGLFKVKGKINSDHNTICIDLCIPYIDKSQPPKRTGRNIRASEEKWDMFRNELHRRMNQATSIITNHSVPFEQRYKKYYKELENAARVSIGKTTFKNN